MRWGIVLVMVVSLGCGNNEAAPSAGAPPKTGSAGSAPTSQPPPPQPPPAPKFVKGSQLNVDVAITPPPLPTGHFLIGPKGFNPRGVPVAVVDTIALLTLLRQKRFAELDAELKWLDGEYRRDYRYEDWIVDGLEAFSVEDAKLALNFDDWIAAYPKSWIAYAARGSYRTAQAYSRRGSAYVDKTPASKLLSFEETLVDARKDLRKALELDPSASAVYVPLVLTREADDAGAFAAGHKACPLCARLYYAYLANHALKWGGSYRELEAIVADAQTHADKNPRLKAMLGYLDEERCGALENTPEAALALCDRAIDASGAPSALIRKARMLWKLQRNADALPFVDRALAARPRAKNGYMLRARVLAMLGRLDDTAKDLELAWLITAGSSETDGMMYETSRDLRKEAVAQLDAGKPDVAAAKLDVALRLNANNLDAHYWRAVVYSRSGDRAKARAEIEEMFRRDSAQPQRITEIGQDFRVQRNWKASAELWTLFLEVRPDSELAYAKRAIAFHHLGKAAEAKKDLDEACRRNTGGQGPCGEARYFIANSPP